MISCHIRPAMLMMSAMDDSSSPDSSETSRSVFCTTRWSLVLLARADTSSDSAASLETLCRQYWPPLYAYVRGRGHSLHDAQDLTQEFFSRLLAKNWLSAADPARGRFRSFLLIALKRFLANEWDHAQAQKRGGTMQRFELDPQELAEIPAPESMAGDADALYDRQWALALLQKVMQRLRAEHVEAGRVVEYEQLKPCLVAERGELDYEALATLLKMSAVSTRSVVHRLRKRFREMFREEVAATVEKDDDIEEEMRAVITALGAA